MRRNGKCFGVRLSNETVANLERVARVTGENRSQTIRRALAIGLPFLESGADPNLRRLLVIIEHTQMALAHLMETEYPDVAQELIQLAQDNVAEYHG